MRRIIAFGVLVTIISIAFSGCSMLEKAEETYPGRQIDLIVPYSTGGPADITSRALVPSLETELGQTVVVVNKPGASGVIGFSYIASAPKDGYTIGLVPLSSVCINHVLGELTYDPITDFEFIGGVTDDPVALCVSVDSPFNTLSELLDYAKDHPNELSVATSGLTSMDTLMCLDVAKTAGVEFNIVSFDGGGDILAAVMGGHADIMGGTYGEMIAYANAGQLKILAVGEEGLGIPTFEEEGYPITLNKQIRGIIAPGGLEENAKNTLVKAVKAAVMSSAFENEMAKIEMKPRYYTPEECTEYCSNVTKALDKFKE